VAALLPIELELVEGAAGENREPEQPEGSREEKKQVRDDPRQ